MRLEIEIRVTYLSYGVFTVLAKRTLFVAAFVYLLFLTSASAQETWGRGNIVGLRAETCIREGPGFNYRAHTRVPENNWAVMIIDGPRTANGHIWWDTSRQAAGDPSGGTGWVTEDQSDTDCGTEVVPIQPEEPNPAPNTVTPPTSQDFFNTLRSWWYQQSALFKWVVAIVALLLVPILWNSIGIIVINFVSAVFLTVAIWIVMDITRSFWEEEWLGVGGVIFGSNVPDLALLLSVLPLVSWGISVIRRLVLKR